MPLPCNAKIVATLGPASADRATIEALVRAGADVFRLNFSHGTHADHQQRLALIREASDRLRRAGLDVRVEPSTNIALQSIHDDLADVQRERFGRNQEIADQVAQLGARVSEIDRLSGPLHQLMTVQTLELACQTMAHMTQVLDQQAQALASAATTAPAH